MHATELAKRLGENVLWGACAPGALVELAEKGAHQQIKAGAIIYERGAPAQDVFFLLRGSLRVFQSHGDKRLTTTILEAPSTIGELEVLAEDAGGEARGYVGNIVALQDTDLLKVSAPAFIGWLKANPAAAWSLLGDISRRGCRAATREPNVFFDVPVRLAALLLELVAQSGRPGPPYKLDVTRSDLADHLGATVRSVGRAFNDFKKKGLIGHYKGWLLVRDLAGLEEQCAGQRFHLVHRTPGP